MVAMVGEGQSGMATMVGEGRLGMAPPQRPVMADREMVER